MPSHVRERPRRRFKSPWDRTSTLATIALLIVLAVRLGGGARAALVKVALTRLIAVPGQQQQQQRHRQPLQQPQQQPPGPKRRLVVHIGPHKTGTSYFQMLAQQNKGLSPTLQWPTACGKHVGAKGFADFAKHVCRPAAAPKSGANAANGNAPKIFWALPVQGCEAQSQRYLDTLKKGTTSADLLISAEDFSSCGPDGFLRLRRMFEPEFQVEVLVVRRDSRSLLLSRYRESHRYKPVTSNLTEALPQLRQRAGLCSFAGRECLRALADAFGGDHVHVVSYEGLRAAKTGLFDESCRLLSRPPSGCFQRPQKTTSGPYYKSEPYARYSAAVIFNRLAAELRCSGPNSRPPASVSQGSKLVDAFMGDLKRAGVEKLCRPLADVLAPVEACEERCVAEAIADGSLPVRGYMFSH